MHFFNEHYCINDKAQQSPTELQPAGFTQQVIHSYRTASPHLQFNSWLSKITSYSMTQPFGVPEEDYKSCVWNPSDLGICWFSFVNKCPCPSSPQYQKENTGPLKGKSRDPEERRGRLNNSLRSDQVSIIIMSHSSPVPLRRSLNFPEPQLPHL